MRLTLEKVEEFRKKAIDKRKELALDFIDAHSIINSDNKDSILIIAQYNYWGGYAYAMEKIDQFKRLKK
jgi:hypothetical protein